MNCEECRQEPATVHLTRLGTDANPGEQRSENHWCEVCARKTGLAPPRQAGKPFAGFPPGFDPNLYCGERPGGGWEPVAQ